MFSFLFTTKMSEKSNNKGNFWMFYGWVLQTLLFGSLVIGMLWMKTSYDRLSIEVEELKKKVGSHDIDGSVFEKMGLDDAFFKTLLNAKAVMSDLDSQSPGDSTVRARRSSEAQSLAETLTRAFMTAMTTLCAPDEKYCLPGPKGQTGAQGQPGFPGYAGGPGQPGLKGDKGEAGDNGEDGKPGKTGQPGGKGEAGSKGEKGSKGTLGLKGNQTIAQGMKGSKGERGFGLPGKKGEVGEDEDGQWTERRTWSHRF